LHRECAFASEEVIELTDFPADGLGAKIMPAIVVATSSTGAIANNVIGEDAEPRCIVIPPGPECGAGIDSITAPASASGDRKCPPRRQPTLFKCEQTRMASRNTVRVRDSMDDTSQTLKPWVTFAGCVLVVVVLYWAQTVLVPVALALLLTFVLTPPVTWLERRVGRVPAVLAAVTLVFIILGLAGWGVARQIDRLADDLPTYRVNILAKIADIRGAGKGGSVEKLQETIEGIKTDLGQSSAPKGTASRPVVVSAEVVRGFSGFSWLGPIVGPMGTAGLVLAMMIFMLLERRDLRDRLIGLFGHGQLTITTKAFDEAGRVSAGSC
jgi:hypothetical protein